jgi:hypothetical protein
MLNVKHLNNIQDDFSTVSFHIFNRYTKLKSNLTQSQLIT